MTPLQDPPYLSLSGTLQPSGNSLFAKLPQELLSNILQDVVVSECDGSPSAYYTTMHTFSKLLTTCKAFYDVGTPILYSHAAFVDPNSFARFLHSISITGYGTLVRVLDFSGFTAIGSNKSAFTSDALASALELCPNLTEFLGTENIEKQLNDQVLSTLFTLPYITAVDFCGATDPAFADALAKVADSSNTLSSVERLSLHGCSSLPASTIDLLLQKLPYLTRLDLTDTLVTTSALANLPTSARLTHLSLSKCCQLDSAATRTLFQSHPAFQSLIWLNLMFDTRSPNHLSPISSTDAIAIVASLPPLKYLNLFGLPVSSMPLQDVSNLESLSLGHANIPVPELKKFLPKFPRLEYIDLTGNPHINIWTVQDQTLLNCNPAIRMFEFSRDLLCKMDGISIPGFKAAKGQGRRGWLIRGETVPCTTSLSYTTHAGPSVVSGPALSPTVSSPDHKRFTFSAFAKSACAAGPSAAHPAATSTAATAGSKQSMAGRSPRAHFQRTNSNSGTNTQEVSRSPSPATRPVTVTGMDMGTPAWRHASRKTNMCFVGIGGSHAIDSCKERGIYLYYGYRK